MLVGVASFPPSFLSSGTYTFYIINRPNCLNIGNTVYMLLSCESTFLDKSSKAMQLVTGISKEGFAILAFLCNDSSPPKRMKT